MPQKIRFTVDSKGAERNLFSILERSNGDLVLGFGFATSVGYSPENPKILHQKYSVHTSPKSAEFSTITHTIWLDDGTKNVLHVLTDAIKAKTGFFPMFCRRCQILVDDRYLIPASDKATRIKLWSPTELDGQVTLVYGVFVGPSDTPFGPHPQLSVAEWAFTHFRIVVIYHYINLPAHPTGDTMHSLTEPYEHEDPMIRAHLRQMMRGKSTQWCLDYFRQISSLFVIAQARWILRDVPDDDAVARDYFQRFIDHAEHQLQSSESGIVLLQSGTSPGPWNS